MPLGHDNTSYVSAIGIIRYILAKARNPYRWIKDKWDEIYLLD